jgi:hypothetical protein
MELVGIDRYVLVAFHSSNTDVSMCIEFGELLEKALF